MAPTSKFSTGPSIRGYKILEVIGSGGMATIFKGVQESLRRPVAIKELSKVCAQDSNLVERFTRESQVAAGLSHENILHIYDYWHHGDCHCIIMEYVEGVDVSVLLDRLHVLPVTVALIVGYEVSRALHYAHSQGVIHRDIKPANIMLSRKGGVKLTDFGIAQVPGLSSLTLPGTFLGTPAYMSPEQAQGDKLTPASDQFSLGVVLYEILSGMKPFFEDDEKTIFERIRKGDYPHPRKVSPTIPRNFARLVVRCLNSNPQKRFQSMLELTQNFYKLLRRRMRGDPRNYLADFLVDAEVFPNPDFDAVGGQSKPAKRSPQRTPMRMFRFGLHAGAESTMRQDWSLAAGNLQAHFFYRWVRNLCLILLPTLVVWAIHNPAFPRQGPRYEIKRLDLTPSSPQPGFLKVHAQPWALVYVDKQFIALTPTAETFQLSPGSHVVRFFNPAHAAKEIVVELKPGENRKVFMDLQEGTP